MVRGDSTQKDQEKGQRTAAREAFFLEFSQETRKRHPNLVLMLTGGFRSRTGAETAIKENACDLVGMARPAAVNPGLPNLFLDESIPAEEAEFVLDAVQSSWFARTFKSQILGMGAETVSFQYNSAL